MPTVSQRDLMTCYFASLSEDGRAELGKTLRQEKSMLEQLWTAPTRMGANALIVSLGGEGME